jgi:DNA polymerase III delta subunit
VSSQTICVVGTDATMVYDTVHNVINLALGELDPSFALQDFTAKDVTTSGAESVTPRVLEALNTPPFLVDRRVVVVRDAQSLVADEVAALLEWMTDPAPAIVLVLAVVGTKAHKLVKAALEVVEVNVGSRSGERVSFVESKMVEYRVAIDHATAQRIADQVGDDVARVDERCSRSTARRRSTSRTSSRTSATPGTYPNGISPTLSTAATRPRRSSWRGACSTPRAGRDCRS